MPFSSLWKKRRRTVSISDGQQQQKQQSFKQRKKSSGVGDDHFEEISLDSRKRKNTTTTATGGGAEKDDEQWQQDGGEGGRRSKAFHQIAGMQRRPFLCVLILFFINLLNYMDRFTVAGVLNDVINFYRIDDKSAGFLQTIFIIFFMTFAPICGFLGDRFNRKWIIVGGEIVWVGAVLASSFVPRDHFGLFLLLRGVVGIGEASYAVIAPTMIADMFAGKMRSRIFMFFYFAIPVGSGLGYVVGSAVTAIARGGRADCEDCWQWGIRATPIIGLITLIALIVGVEEPVRGQAEADEKAARESSVTPTENLQSNRQNPWAAAESAAAAEEQQTTTNSGMDRLKRHLRTASDDLTYLAKNRTFVWSTVAYTAVVFVTGTLTWWAPAAIEDALAWQRSVSNSSDLPDKSSVALTFGGITCLSGFVGVALGSLLAIAWKQGKWLFAGHASPRADPIISAVGSFGATPLLFLAIKMFDWNLVAGAWIILFFTIVCLCLNWAINVDMLMSIIVPHRRNIANAVQISLLHALGDASSPWIVGSISDWVRGDNQTSEAKFHALMVAFYLPNVLLFVSGLAFLAAAYTLPTALRQIEEWKRTQLPPQRQQLSPPGSMPMPTNGHAIHQRQPGVGGGGGDGGIRNQAFE